MKKQIAQSCLFLVLGMSVVPLAIAHPYEGDPHHAPLAFVPHDTDGGRIIYTNIPRTCFNEGRLSCAQLHPLFGGKGTVHKSNDR